MRLNAMGLIAGAIFLLVAPGILYNNASNSGLVNGANGVGAWALTCPGWPDVTCQSNVNVGCQASSAHCALSGQTVSFLNINSPFTSLIQGNVFGLFTQVNTNNGYHGPFDPLGVSQYYRANCVISDTVGKGLRQWVFDKCTTAAADASNATEANSPKWGNWNTLLNGTSHSIYFYQLPNATYVSGAVNWIAQINYTNNALVTGYTWYGIDFYHPSGACSPATNNGCSVSKEIFSLAVSVPYEVGALSGGSLCAYGGSCYHENVWITLLNWDFAQCLSSHAQSSNNFASQQCDYFRENFQNLGSSAGSTSSLGLGWFTPIITFLIGLALLLVSLGVTVGAGGSILGSGTSFSVGANNPQGSRLTQAIGVGLLVWSPLYSEFSPWFTTGILPYGLDGTAGIMSLVLTGMFFFGIWWFTRGSD